jgi:hypothetical protein
MTPAPAARTHFGSDHGWQLSVTIYFAILLATVRVVLRGTGH